ncbi:cell division protein FtsQ/DivIB [Allofrancisella guangzhouensis]|uniref:Cell division protein FtsQ n=1 Tax=Allofrancisella guangzhouensis TaxID=594679 RepID=A0A0A8E4D4_9GAMM|nr:cell division protein FtsQ/DivIB [Allofrancisella guangzhouensis]AJC48462.1 cell division protein FtsQ [Allofrancisella guangzhouensis]MBK2027636.1 cell division protein FtsQ/DivIB [Allofrancisella guangzhouensis]MBK2044036.1 cell division protein FtsQ/DivIB [Allofrancisella guangzhouensis]MBK2046499.1 cell division protein FtsQ/DivIB [Allofrancisella guangzhouensis]
MKALKRLVISLTILVVLFGAVVYLVLQTDRTISKVDIVSNDGLVYISKQQLIDKITGLNQKQWFDFNIQDVRRYLHKIKGVDYFLVKKVWPSTLVIYLYDRKPVAYWDGDKILLDNMAIVKPTVLSYDRELPHIQSSDEGNRYYIYETYRQLNRIAKANSTEIIGIFYKGNQFKLLLSNDQVVILGSKELKLRLKEYFRTYKKVKNYESVEYFDMRYADGFAIKYINNK